MPLNDGLGGPSVTDWGGGTCHVICVDSQVSVLTRVSSGWGVAAGSSVLLLLPVWERARVVVSLRG